MIQSRATYAIVVVATILGFVASILSAAELMVASQNIDLTQALAPKAEISLPPVNPQRAESEHLLRLLQAQQDELRSLHGALSRVVDDQKSRAVQHFAAWMVVTIALSWLTVVLKPHRRKEQD